jgi:acetolactate synthase I/II/III large subunit
MTGETSGTSGTGDGGAETSGERPAASPAETLLAEAAGVATVVPADHTGLVVARVLAEAGVETVFFLPGGHIAPVVNGCARAGIRTVSTRHESGAVHMAEAWARCTGRTGVAAVTAGPGFTNAVTGLANAQATGIPVAVLGGRTPLGLRGRGAVQDAEQEAVARAVAKWSRAVTDPALVVPIVREALAVARSGRPGSAYVELPTDVLLAPAPDAAALPPAAAPERIPPPRADDAAVDRAVALLAAAERPVVVTGGGAFWAGAGPALQRFVEASGLPVTTTSHSRGLLPDAHPACLGSLLHGGVAVALADVVLIVGSRFNGNLLFGGPPLWNADQTIVMVDHDEAAFSLNRQPALGLHGDAAAVLDQLAAAWTGEPRTAWAEEAQSWADGSRAHWQAESEQPAAGVHPGALAREVAAFAAEQGPGTTVVLDGGDILGWGLAFIRAEEPGSLLFTSDALGTIGVGVPYAVGAALARPDGPTVALVGDGAFGLSAMEIETAVRAGAAPVIVVSNNASWGDVRYEEGEWFGASVGTDLSPARYDLLCAALGGHGERVEALDQLRPALERARASGVVSVVDVRTDPDQPNEVLRSMGALALQ